MSKESTTVDATDPEPGPSPNQQAEGVAYGEPTTESLSAGWGVASNPTWGSLTTVEQEEASFAQNFANRAMEVFDNVWGAIVGYFSPPPEPPTEGQLMRRQQAIHTHYIMRAMVKGQLKGYDPAEAAEILNNALQAAQNQPSATAASNAFFVATASAVMDKAYIDNLFDEIGIEPTLRDIPTYYKPQSSLDKLTEFFGNRNYNTGSYKGGEDNLGNAPPAGPGERIDRSGPPTWTLP